MNAKHGRPAPSVLDADNSAPPSDPLNEAQPEETASATASDVAPPEGATSGQASAETVASSPAETQPTDAEAPNGSAVEPAANGASEAATQVETAAQSVADPVARRHLLMGAAYAKVGAGDVSGGVLGMLEVARAHADASALASSLLAANGFSTTTAPLRPAAMAALRVAMWSAVSVAITSRASGWLPTASVTVP